MNRRQVRPRVVVDLGRLQPAFRAPGGSRTQDRRSHHPPPHAGDHRAAGRLRRTRRNSSPDRAPAGAYTGHAGWEPRAGRTACAVVPVAVLLDAVVTVRGAAGTRTLPVRDLLAGAGRTTSATGRGAARRPSSRTLNPRPPSWSPPSRRRPSPGLRGGGGTTQAGRHGGVREGRRRWHRRSPRTTSLPGVGAPRCPGRRELGGPGPYGVCRGARPALRRRRGRLLPGVRWHPSSLLRALKASLDRSGA